MQSSSFILLEFNKESDQTKYIRDLCIEYEEHLLFETDGVKQCIIVESSVKG